MTANLEALGRKRYHGISYPSYYSPHSVRLMKLLCGLVLLMFLFVESMYVAESCNTFLAGLPRL